MERAFLSVGIANIAAAFIFLPGLMLFSLTVYGSRIDYSMGVEAEYMDNATLSSTNEEDDLTRSALFGFSYVENSSRLDASISSLLEYIDYRDNTFSDEDWMYLNGNAVWTIRPSSFFWTVEDYYSQQELSVIAPTTPDNLIDTNIFSTGPDFYLRVNPANQVHIGLRVSDYSFQGTTADSQRATANFAWLSGVSSSLELSLNAEFQTAQFDEVDDSDFNRQDVFFSINYRPSRSRFQLDIGASYIDRDGQDDVNGFLSRLIWRNQFRAQSHFQLEASSQFTDSGLDLLTTGVQSADFDRVGEQISGDIFYDRRLEATYRIGSYGGSYTIQGIYRLEDYEVLPQDRRTREARLGYDYLYSETTTFNGQFQYRYYDYILLDQINREKVASVSMSYRLARNYSMRLEYNYSAQESSVPTSDYTQNRILLSFFYGRDPGSYR